MTEEEKKKRMYEASKRWKAKNPEKVREQHKRNYQRHREQKREYMRNRYKAMKEAYDKMMNSKEN